MPETAPALVLRDLRLERLDGVPIVEGVSLEVGAGEIVALVGESGSGKTTTALAALGHVAAGVRRTAGSVVVDGVAVDSAAGAASIRGATVAYLPQEPGASLDPAARIGRAIRRMLAAHARPSGDDAVPGLLRRVDLPDDAPFARRYPHQLSGGQQQRVATAIAIACSPRLVVLDEPTTGLDVITQGRVLVELRRLRDELGVAMLYITHDLAVVAELADRVAVMYAGHVVEAGTAAQLLSRPRHPYTRGLAAATPDPRRARVLAAVPGRPPAPGERPPGCAFAPRCPLAAKPCAVAPPLAPLADGRIVACHRQADVPALDLPEERPASRAAGAGALVAEGLEAAHRGPRGPVPVVRGVSLAVRTGECVALVGGSGSGKTTIARLLVGLHRPTAGRVLLDGAPLAPSVGGRARDELRRVQLVFQDPLDSLNPRERVGSQIRRPATLLRGLRGSEADAEVARLLDRVHLPRATAERRPAELSGGERQRAAIARALAAGPSFLVCDEITSALDVSVQAAVLELLGELRETGLGILLITHNLGVVAALADRMLVLDAGVVREEGATAAILAEPADPLTRLLIESAPRPLVAQADGEAPNGAHAR